MILPDRVLHLDVMIPNRDMSHDLTILNLPQRTKISFWDRMILMSDGLLSAKKYWEQMILINLYSHMAPISSNTFTQLHDTWFIQNLCSPSLQSNICAWYGSSLHSQMECIRILHTDIQLGFDLSSSVSMQHQMLFSVLTETNLRARLNPSASKSIAFCNTSALHCSGYPVLEIPMGCKNQSIMQTTAIAAIGSFTKLFEFDNTVLSDMDSVILDELEFIDKEV